MQFFKAYKADGMKIPTYFIESTAPDNVDDTAPIPDLPAEFEQYLKEIESEQALQEIAEMAPRPTNSGPRRTSVGSSSSSVLCSPRRIFRPRRW
jgi:hypothetical protein